MLSGRIVKALSGFYYVLTVEESPRTITCRARGIFKHKKKLVTPLVGDLVTIELSSDSEGTVMEVSSRGSELIRPPVANVDQVILVFAVTDPELQPELLDKFLLFIENEQLTPIIVFSKADLIQEDDRALDRLKQISDAYRSIGYDVFILTGDDSNDLDMLLRKMDGRVSVLAGQSGVGKSTLLNRLMPMALVQTGEVSAKLGRGKHTTRHVELIAVPGAEHSFLADTPGFSQLDVSLLTAEQITNGYREFLDVRDQCKFRGCTHVHEPDCAVIRLLAEGAIHTFRYESYKQWMSEWTELKRRSKR